MSAVTGGPAGDEREAFTRYTPSGELKFWLENPNLAGFFEVGKDYYLDITPVPAGPGE